ncbi:AraC family transcriptional regulator [Pseudomonas sp. KU43P]|uniref:AraC family transcriptional regulator n=1 Tax=Pseudomonas sp. KU43P TaxID=2487887 RepID=UPI0012AA8A58|nr:AraC family transcriptional regulator [Pseudomonas sp. KU43P]BBH45740.1 AraC family transcriptional regulator [Pseudomonas sp. KU43P]
MANMVVSACLTHYADVARAFGLDPIAQLQAVQLDPACLERSDFKISVDSVWHLLENSASQAGVEDFGLRMAEQRQLSNLGTLAQVMRQESTLRMALETLQRYLHLHNEGFLILVEERDGIAVIRGEQITHRQLPSRQSVDLMIGVTHRTLKTLLGEQWQPRSVCLRHSAPQDRSTHLRLFGTRVQFNSVVDGIVCRSAELDAPLPGSDPVAARSVRRELEARGAVSETVVDTVRRLVWQLLLTGRLSVEQVAEQLGVDRRTVHRRLLRHGESFSSILDQVRQEQVVRHLRDSRHSHSEIAELLGFSCLSAFSRWFSQRFGCSPRAWRKGHVG